MDFSDEHYVKLYTRRTATRELWPWQARALHPNLLMTVDKAGILDVGTREPVRVLSIMVGLPADVVEPGLKALLEDGSVELHGGQLVVPRFVQAQEARKTRAAVVRDHRQKKSDMARANRATSQDSSVTNRDESRPTVTSGDPSTPTPTPTPSSARPLPDPDPDPASNGGRSRSPSVWEQLAETLELQRIQHCKAKGIAPGVQEPPRAPNLAFTKAAKAVGLVDEIIETDNGPQHLTVADKLQALWLQYLEDDFGRIDERDGRERIPPWPLELFLKPAVLGRLLKHFDGEAAA